ncbi:autotransporter domain-containing protein [Fusobacterium ulcerans]|uniref:Uncharacterized protein with a C-terminal OMP (Outer membrane protein) domain n=1 Tax=Fusobacterium ulcerans TaxID=861 RepID=A0AAX2J723_9FUSO|nr:autotransporter domain-containing protein [Fusobacterium ulcerans]AVQ28353.1 autotransporter domain-containing protein [Fusobacterium ulcerans]EFS25820.1 hypothetical protein FUAG_01335 [Fusobacterium ulcerans ATCC 49185]SQJ00151.1 Uncharacterized protein with a C-terminal OMP (outer membrane protein) domain [Fusobacterium ulcerans]
MISNFSEVEKSLKRCLKEKVSITAATVVGFLIAGTVAFGVEKTVTFTTTTDGQVTVQVEGVEGAAPITGANKSISVEKYLELVKAETESEQAGALAGLLTVKTDDKGVTTFAGAVGGEDTLGTVSATATDKGALTLITTDETNTSITSSLKIEAAGEEGKLATAMSADGEGHTVTNDGAIAVGKYAVGMSAKNGGTAVNNAEKTITVNGTGAVGMSAENGASIENQKDATIAISSAAGKGMVVTGNGTATNAGTIEVNNEESVGMLATTEAGQTATLINNGTIDVQAGTGIKVAGEGTTTITGGTITGTTTAVGIDVASSTGTLTIKNTKITVGAGGTGIKATGNTNITLKDGVILGLNAAGTGIAYTGDNGTTVTTANISTGDIDVQAGNGIIATMSKATGSTLDITTGTIKTENSKIGIKITGADGATTSKDKENTTATVTTTLGETAGTGVSVAGEAYNDITVNLGAADVAAIAEETSKAEVSGTGVEITANKANGKVVVNVNQDNLQVTDGKKLVGVTANAGDLTINTEKAVELLTGANLVDVTANTGNLTVNLNADKQSVVKGSLVNIASATGTTNVNINENVELKDNDGSIVKAAMTAGKLNINLNVEGDGLTVGADKVALDLSGVASSGTASVKNTGSVTIKGTGTLVEGHGSNATTTLTNQGLITVSAVNASNPNDSSHISVNKVAVENYGTIKLDISSEDFIAKAGDTAAGKSLDQLTIAEVQTALSTLGVIGSSDEAFSSIGYIDFKDEDKSFTTAKELSGEETVDDLAANLDHQPEDERGFEVKANNTLTLSSESKNDKLENVQFNLKGTMEIGGTEEVKIDNAGAGVKNQIQIKEDGQLKVAAGAELNYSGNISATNTENTASGKAAIINEGTLTLSNGTLNMVEPDPNPQVPVMASVFSAPTDRVAIFVDGDKITNLDGFTINGNILGKLNVSSLQGTINFKGISAVNGTVTDIKTIEVKDGMLTFGADSAIVSNATTETTDIKLTGGKMGVKIGENGGNVLENSEGEIKFTGLNQTGKVVLLTGDLTENTTFRLGTHTGLNDGDVTADGDIYYKITQGEGGKWNATFNEDALLEATGTKYLELGNIFVGTQAIHDLLSKDPNVRVAQLDDLYSNNIYSETVKMSLDTLKMNEDAVLSLNVRPKQGEFTAQGKFLFNNTDYDREGVTRDYKVETKNNGLLGVLEYGLTDTSSVGFAFSGTKQDLDMKNGASADGDAFYFGLYRNDTFNNIDLTTGLGYMIDRVDAENFIGKDKFDSTALSGYIQGKYNYAIGENLTLSPKARLTVTRFQQDSINNGRMKQEEIKDTIADVELGVELKKGIALETGKMNLLAGASFTTNVAGKDDDYYKVNFISKAGNNGASTKVKGANLEKNSLKLNVGADVELTNGVFYNGGLSYEFDDEDRDSIGVTLGAGYKF